MALTVQVGSYPEVCGYGNGSAWAAPYGGTAPYTYLWDNGATTAEITGLLPGTYSVTVTDNLGALASGSTTVVASTELQVYFSYQTPTCPGYCAGVSTLLKIYLAGTPPYTFSVTPTSEDADNANFTGVCWYAENQPLTITDANGCSVTTTLGVPNSYYAQPEILQIMPSCQGVAGHVTFQLDFTMFTTLQVYDAQLNEVYTDLAPPSGIPITVSDLAPGDYTIRCTTNEIVGGWCYGETLFSIFDLGTDCGRIQGHLFIDADDDCTFDTAEETGMPYRVLAVEPGPVYGMTDAQGAYTIELQEGSYTLQNDDADLFPICPAMEPWPFDITAFTPIVIQELADSSSVAPDLELTCVYSEPRPGFTYHVWLTIKNLSPYFAGSPNLVFTYDPLLIFQSSSYGSYILSPGQITWPGMYFLPGFDTRTIHVQFMVPADQGLIGTQLASTGFVQQTPLEPDETNNTCTETTTIIGSYDPNDKTAFTSSRQSEDLYFIDQDTSIVYVIRFQNTGTASAINVEVTDTLPPELDPATMRLLGWSHTLGDVQITDGPVMHWFFNNIYLPDSGFNEPASHGFVSYSIKPRLPVLPGTVIENTAKIFFDFNDPVITEPSVLVAEFSTSIPAISSLNGLEVFPNPAEGSVSVRIDDGGIRSLQLCAADGRRLFQVGADGAATCTIDLSALSSGAYFITVITSAGKQLRTRVTKC